MYAIFCPARLRELRRLAGLSRPALARQVALSPLSLKDYETGRNLPSVAALGRIAGALACPIDALYDRDGEAA